MADTRKFMMKWLKDFLTLQKDDENLPYILSKVPMNVSEGVDLDTTSYGCAGWSHALIHIPCILYRFYGDTSAMEMVYDAAKNLWNLV